MFVAPHLASSPGIHINIYKFPAGSDQDPSNPPSNFWKHLWGLWNLINAGPDYDSKAPVVTNIWHSEHYYSCYRSSTGLWWVIAINPQPLGIYLATHNVFEIHGLQFIWKPSKQCSYSETSFDYSKCFTCNESSSAISEVTAKSRPTIRLIMISTYSSKPQNIKGVLIILMLIRLGDIFTAKGC